MGGLPLIRDWNLEITRVEPGLAHLAMVPNTFTVNGTTGIVNGGVLATLADVACALALSTHFDGKMPFATADLHIRYLEPAIGPIVLEASVVRASARSGVLECRTLCAGQVVTLATTQFVITNRPKATP